MDSRVREVENSSSFISNRFDECTKDLCKTKSDIQTIQKSCENAENTVSELKVNTSHMQERITELECRAMRENLIFYGIAESVDENCEILVKNMCSVNLGIDTAKTFTFDRAHRLGGDNSKKPRPIVVKFHYFSEREKVRLKSYEQDSKDRLKQAKLGVGEQWPSYVRQRGENYGESAVKRCVL